jgi:hypothetical protein
MALVALLGVILGGLACEMVVRAAVPVSDFFYEFDRNVGLKGIPNQQGLSGFGTAREYMMLRAYGLRYKPDLVVMFFVGNDISDNSRRLQGKPFVPYPVPGPDGGVSRDERGQPHFSPFADRMSSLGAVATILRNHSKSYRALREAIDAKQ